MFLSRHIFRRCHSVLMTFAALPSGGADAVPSVQTNLFLIFKLTTNINVRFSTPEETARIADRGWRRPFKSRHGLAGIVCSRTPSHRPAQFEFVASKKLRGIFFRDSATPEDPPGG